MSLFQALKHAKSRSILKKVLEVIIFYNKTSTTIQKDIINPDTILWLLNMIEDHKGDKKLCFLAAKTLLAIVSDHEIIFDYQEVAIIKKFNQALQNLDVAVSEVDDLSSLGSASSVRKRPDD